MTDHNERNRRLLAPLGLAALAALAVVGCSARQTGPVAIPTSTVTVTPAADPTQAEPAPAPPVPTTVAAPATISVHPEPNTVRGPFESPSGNIVCSMYVSTTGSDNVMCAAAEHDWLAPKPADCQLAWGDRIDLEAGAPAHFGCYGQEMPPVTHTLEYGQYQELGSLSCSSETVGIMCIDNTSGHFFSISRQNHLMG